MYHVGNSVDVDILLTVVDSFGKGLDEPSPKLEADILIN